MSEAKLRQIGLPLEDTSPPLPLEVESKIFELLVQLLLGVEPVMVSEGGEPDE